MDICNTVFGIWSCFLSSVKSQVHPKAIKSELSYQTLSLRQVTVQLEFVTECNLMHLSHR